METKDYTHHRLTNDNEVLAYRTTMGVPEFWDYFDRLHTKVHSMNPGQSFHIDDVVVEENRDLFIKLLCNFINECPGLYLFNNTYTTFYKLEPIVTCATIEEYSNPKLNEKVAV